MSPDSVILVSPASVTLVASSTKPPKIPSSFLIDRIPIDDRASREDAPSILKNPSLSSPPSARREAEPGRSLTNSVDKLPADSREDSTNR